MCNSAKEYSRDENVKMRHISGWTKREKDKREQQSWPLNHQAIMTGHEETKLLRLGRHVINGLFGSSYVIL